jgi:hypothetical protein
LSSQTLLSALTKQRITNNASTKGGENQNGIATANRSQHRYSNLEQAKQANPNEPPLKSTAMEHIIQEAVALEYRHLWNPNGSMTARKPSSESPGISSRHYPKRKPNAYWWTN